MKSFGRGGGGGADLVFCCGGGGITATDGCDCSSDGVDDNADSVNGTLDWPKLNGGGTEGTGG